MGQNSIPAPLGKTGVEACEKGIGKTAGVIESAAFKDSRIWNKVCGFKILQLVMP